MLTEKRYLTLQKHITKQGEYKMKTPQEFIWEYVQLQNTKIAKHVYNNLNKEKYWLAWTNGKEAYWNFEHNSLESIPNRDYYYIKKVLKSNGYKYYAD